MANFKYDFSAGSAVDRFRHYISLPGDTRQTQAVTFTIEAGFTGDLDVTTLAWQPDALIVFGTEQAPAEPFQDYGALHLGATDGTNQWAMGVFTPYLTGLDPYVSVHKDDQIISAVWETGQEIEASFVTFLTDGFRINVSDAPTIDTGFAVLAMKGGGSYYCGTDLSPAADGTQALTGFGFAPDGGFFATAQRDALSVTLDMARMSLGGADGDSQHNVWAGGFSGDAYNDSNVRDDRCLSMYEDADFGGPFLPGLLSEARVDSFDGDGLTLDWSDTDGTQRYFSWLAFDGGTEEARWTYNHSSSGGPVTITTIEKPKGLIFFCDDKGDDTYPLGHNDGTFGFGLGLGVCDQNLAQYAAGLAASDQPDFNQIQSVRELRDDIAFGAYASTSQGTMPNNMRDCGTIVAFLAGEWVPQIYRRVIQG